jgi:hypothetical protein
MFTRFKFSIYTQDGRHNRVYQASGNASDYSDYSSITLPGFKGGACVSLVDCWQHILQTQPEKLTREVTSYETFVKFGEVIQQKSQFEIRFWLSY